MFSRYLSLDMQLLCTSFSPMMLTGFGRPSRIVYCVKNLLPTSSDFYVTASLTKYIPLDGSLHVSRGMSLAKEMTSGGGEGTLTSEVAPSIF